MTSDVRQLEQSSITPESGVLVYSANFLHAMRDSGYRTSAFAIAELVDNAIQAEASRIVVDVVDTGDREFPVEVMVIDDGIGLDHQALSSALAFGGTTRFGSRSSLGRYGMGLPNGSITVARRVEVYTWSRNQILRTHLDLDEFIEGRQEVLPVVECGKRPPFIPKTKRGTAVRLTRCDRLEYRRASTIAQRLVEEFGRIYRRFLGAGIEMEINGTRVARFDPLFLDSHQQEGGVQFGDTLYYQLSDGGLTGQMEVRFSELPVERWHDLPAPEKRRLGISNGPVMSIVRSGREIDRGWWFMGSKRRENYDDWWRCEVSFEPALDELFGITHTKQGITPRSDLLATLVPDLEPIARALNKRVRQRFEQVKLARSLSPVERQAARAEPALPRLPRRPHAQAPEVQALIDDLPSAPSDCRLPYRVVVAELPTTAAFEVVRRGEQLILLVNARHPLYRDLCGPLTTSESETDQKVGKQIMLTILAAARAEASGSQSGSAELHRFRHTWGDVLATFFNA
ncbi:ATP-binding protein [Nocardia sp. NPDC051321]|uniref:ATP-binding protein n=1 Tax=Nocardia sp. NPDC051321 TaxID=3364323 RepID=UPI0037A7D906